jgi:hypothetical protein
MAERIPLGRRAAEKSLLGPLSRLRERAGVRARPLRVQRLCRYKRPAVTPTLSRARERETSCDRMPPHLPYRRAAAASFAFTAFASDAGAATTTWSPWRRMSITISVSSV